MTHVRFGLEVVDHSGATISATRSLAWHLTRRPLSVVARWMERSRQRRDLANLDDWALRDIGISRAEAEREVATPFWR